MAEWANNGPARGRTANHRTGNDGTGSKPPEGGRSANVPPVTGAADRIVVGRCKLRAEGAGLGTSALRAANQRGRVTARPPLPMVRLGLTVVDGHGIDATMPNADRDSVGLGFRDLEPEVIGSVARLGSGAPHFTPQRVHAERAAEPGRPERLIAAALDAYRNRPDPR